MRLRYLQGFLTDILQLRNLLRDKSPIIICPHTECFVIYPPTLWTAKPPLMMADCYLYPSNDTALPGVAARSIFDGSQRIPVEVAK